MLYRLIVEEGSIPTALTSIPSRCDRELREMPGIASATQVSARAEERFLRRLPFIFGALTAGVVLVASVLVQAHVDGWLTLDERGYQAQELSSHVNSTF